MPQEYSARKPGLVEGVTVRLSDGGLWLLPLRDPGRIQPGYDELLAAVCEAEDRPEGLRAELALAVYLLDRNYDLSADQLLSLLSFPPGDPDLIALQEALHGVVLESLARLRRAGEIGKLPEDSSPERHLKAGPAKPTRPQSFGTLGLR